MSALVPPPPYRPTGGCEAASVDRGPMCGATPATLFPQGWRCRTHRPDRHLRVVR